MSGDLWAPVTATWNLLVAMAPYLVLGLLAAGLLHVILPDSAVARYLGGRGFRPVALAAVLGVPLPLCSCSVVPVAVSLRQRGASRAATVGFLVTTPTSGVDSILATYALLGLPFTAARVLWSFVLGLVAGGAAVVLQRGEEPTAVQRDDAPAQRPPLHQWPVLAVRHAFGELLAGIARPLVVGLVVAGLIAWLVPPDAITAWQVPRWATYAVVLAVAIPLYICASGSIPLAAALVAAGFSPGAALVLLVAGPATNAAALTVLGQILGRRHMLSYLGVLVVGSLVGAQLLDLVWQWAGWPLPQVVHDHAASLGVGGTLLAAAFGLLLLGHVVAPYLARLGSGAKTGGESMIAYRVPDMTCAHCAATITGAVRSIEGVRDVRVDLVSKKVAVDADVDAAPEIRRAMEQAGYHPEEA